MTACLGGDIQRVVWLAELQSLRRITYMQVGNVVYWRTPSSAGEAALEVRFSAGGTTSELTQRRLPLWGRAVCSLGCGLHHAVSKNLHAHPLTHPPPTHPPTHPPTCPPTQQDLASLGVAVHSFDNFVELGRAHPAPACELVLRGSIAHAGLCSAHCSLACRWQRPRSHPQTSPPSSPPSLQPLPPWTTSAPSCTQAVPLARPRYRSGTGRGWDGWVGGWGGVGGVGGGGGWGGRCA